MIKVTEEGREGIYIPEKESLINFVKKYKPKKIHSYLAGPALIGCDYDKSAVIKSIQSADRLGIVTGTYFTNNLRHALSVITLGELLMFDIGEITVNQLEVMEN